MWFHDCEGENCDIMYKVVKFVVNKNIENRHVRSSECGFWWTKDYTVDGCKIYIYIYCDDDGE